MSKNGQQVPKFEDDTDLLISQLKSEIKSLQSQNSSSQDKLIEGISKVEEQLNIQSPEDSNIFNLNPTDRILRVGSNIKSLHSQIQNQIYDIFNRGLYDTEFLKDTLASIQDELEGSAMILVEDNQTQVALQNLRQIAMDDKTEIEKLREALEQSLKMHQDSECKIMSLRARISNLEHQIIFYIESNKNPGKNPENLSIDSDDEATTELSPFSLDMHANSLQLDLISRTVSHNRNRSASVRSKKFYKPYNSINPSANEGVDQFSLSKVQQQKLESDYKDQIFQLNSQITKYKSKIELDKQSMIKLKTNFDKMKQNYKILSKKFAKLQEINKQNKEKIKELEETIGKLKKQGEELTEKKELLQEQFEKAQSKNVKDDQLLNKYKSALTALKKKFDQLKQKNDSLESQFLIVQKSILPKEESQIAKIEGQTTADKIVNCYNQLKEQNKNQNSYFLNIRQALGLNNESINLREQTNSEVMFNKEIIDQVAKINDEVENYKNQLKQVKTTLGMSELSPNDEESSIIDKIKNYQNENEQIKNQLNQLRKTLGLPEKGSNTGEDINEVIKQTENTTKENQQLKEQINQMKKAMGINDSDSKENQSGSNITEQIKNQKEENEILKKLLQNINSQLGLPPINEKEPAAINKKCSIVEAEIKQLKENKEKLQEEMNSLKKSLGLENMKSESDDIASKINNINSENAALKKQIQNMNTENATFKEQIQKMDTENAKLKEQIQNVNSENVKLKEQISEICEMLGIPNVTERSIDIENNNSLGSGFNKNINQIKTKLTELQNENDNMKQQIINLAESLNIDNTKLKESKDQQTNEEAIKNINAQIIKRMKTLEEEMRILKRALGIEEGEEGNQNSTTRDQETKSGNQLLNKIQNTTEENANMKTQLNKLRELLGLPQKENQKDSNDLFAQIENLQKRITEQDREMRTLKKALGIEDDDTELNKNDKENSSKLKSQNMIDMINTMNKENAELKEKIKKMRESLGLPSSEEISDDKNLFARIDEVNSENSVLKKQIQNMCKMLGIPEIKLDNKEGGENTIAKQLENASNKIKTKLTELQNENDNMKQQIINLAESLNIDNKKLKESKDQQTNEEAIKNINAQIIKRMKTLEEEMRTLKRALGIEEGEEGDQNSTTRDQETKSGNHLLNKIQNTTEENANMKTQLNKLRELLGLPQKENQKDSNDLFAQIENLQKRITEQDQEMRTLKRALGIENENEQSKEGNQNQFENVLNVIQNTAQENTDLKEQIQNMSAENAKSKEQIQNMNEENAKLKEQIQNMNTENAKLKEQIQNINTENAKLKEQISEMCAMLGIPNVTERSIDVENSSSLGTGINEIKNRLAELQNEKDNMKQQIINLADSLNIDNTKLKESKDQQTNEEAINNICAQIKELYQHKQLLQDQQDSIRTTLGFPTITNEELKASVTKAENGNKEPLLAYIENMKSILLSLANTLGTDPNDLISDSILEQMKLLKQNNESLKEQNDKQENEMKTIKEALGIENTNMKEQLNKLRNILGLPSTEEGADNDALIQRIDEVNSENSVLKKQIQDMCKMLGIPEIKLDNKEGGENAIVKQLENASNKIKTKLTELQNENDNMKQQIINLAESLNIDNKKLKESKDQQTNEEAINNINTQIIKRMKTLEEEMRTLKRALGIEEGEEGDQNSTTRDQETKSGNHLLNKIQNTTEENANMKTQLNKLRELLGLPQKENQSNSNEIIQAVSNMKNENSELQKINQLNNAEFKEIESLLQEEFELDKEDKTKQSKSKTARAIKRLKKNNKQLNAQLESMSNQHEQEKQNLIKKIADKKKKIEELNQNLIEVQSKASGMIEERSSIYNKIQSLQDSIVDVIKAPDSPKSPVYQKLNGISQEISNQQSMIGELANDKERLKKLEKFEEERNQIIDELLSNGLLSVQDRKEVDLSHKIGELLQERKEIMSQSEETAKERSAVLNILGDESDSNDGIATAFKKLQESKKKLEKELSNKQEQLDSIKKALGLPTGQSGSKDDQIISSIKEMNNKNKNLQNQVKTIRESLGLPPNETENQTGNEKNIPISELISNLRNQINELQEKVEANKKERNAILSSLGISNSSDSTTDSIIAKIEKIKNENKNLNKEHSEIVNSLSNFGDGQDHEDVVQSLKNLAQERQTITRTIFSQDDQKITPTKQSRSPLKEQNISLKKSKSSVLFKTSSEVIKGLERIVNDAQNGAGNKAQLRTFESKLDLICAEFGVKFEADEKSSSHAISVDKKLECLSKSMKSKVAEITELKKQLKDYKESIQRVQKLLGVEDVNSDSLDKNIAAKLEEQLINFITKTEEEKENGSSELEDKMSDLKKKLELLQSMLDKLKNERQNALNILGVNDEKSDSILDEVESPLIEAIQKLLNERKELIEQIEKLKEHLTTAAEAIQNLSGERNSIMQALMSGTGLADSQLDRTTRILFKNLESLGIQISKQNDSMNSAIGDNSPREISESSSGPIPKLKKRERHARPQSHIVAALNEIRSKLENAQKETADKEIKIAELEDEIDKLKKK